jgi:predicted NBD/HSP70 family sugar kinase
MSLQARVFVGVDCGPNQLMMGFVGADGILRGLSLTQSPPSDQPELFAQRIHGMVRGLRGEENLRMKQFQGLGIGLPAGELAHGPACIEHIRRVWDVPVRIADRDELAVQGAEWLVEVGSLLDPRMNVTKHNLAPVFGAAKLAMAKSV